jgi:hypothetical protein
LMMMAIRSSRCNNPGDSILHRQSGVRPATPEFERVETVRALDIAAAMTGPLRLQVLCSQLLVAVC